MIEEYQSIMKNYVWDVVPRLEGKSAITSKGIYKIKDAVDGSVVAATISQNSKKNLGPSFRLG